MATESSEGEEEGKLMAANQHLVVDDDLREMAKKAAWSVSSYKPGNGVLFLCDNNLDTYWQSDGVQPHLVNIQFQKKVKLQLVVLYVDFKLDESYTPSKVSIRAGDGFHNLREIKTVELVKPTGWVYISLSGNDPRSYGELCLAYYGVGIRLLGVVDSAGKHLLTLSCCKLLYCPTTSMGGTHTCAKLKFMAPSRTLFHINHISSLRESSLCTLW
ncbi:anaphase-promoting complex subunit 10-like isoform X3 [Malania oleifera]|nr:anaphase-promoting complex subunit 10-like isoform X3 [Malania oleifera]XP_057973645.1 anaphase-promoting complex subunit 10-like isoform X3 [Malania oleifera]